MFFDHVPSKCVLVSLHLVLGWLEVLRVFVRLAIVCGSFFCVWQGSMSSGPLILVRICRCDCNYMQLLQLYTSLESLNHIVLFFIVLIDGSFGMLLNFP